MVIFLVLCVSKRAHKYFRARMCSMKYKPWAVSVCVYVCNIIMYFLMP